MGVPLYHAISQSYYDVFKQLLNAGADPNLENRHGKTPLAVAFQRIKNKFESIAIIIQLLDAGADPNIARPMISHDYGRLILDRIVNDWKKTGEAKGAKIPGEELDTSDEGQKYNRLTEDLARKIQGDLFGRGPVLD